MDGDSMTTKPIELCATETLPPGFRYPEKFVAMIAANDLPDLYPWTFVDAQSEAGRLLYSLRKADGRNLIPFATLESGDGDTACFDGDNTTGHPAVLMLVLDGSGRSYAFADFEDWIRAAEVDAKRWRGR